MSLIHLLIRYASRRANTKITSLEDLRIDLFFYRRSCFLCIDYRNSLIVFRQCKSIENLFLKKYNLVLKRYPYLDGNIWVSTEISAKVDMCDYYTTIDVVYEELKKIILYTRN